MNRLVLIGNGFDLAHGLKTSYENFLYWYWQKRFSNIYEESTNTSTDILCSITTLKYESWRLFMHHNYQSLPKWSEREYFSKLCDKNNYSIKYSPFFKRIYNSIGTLGWVDIENEYYNLLKKYALEDSSMSAVGELNAQLQYIQNLLVEYLKSIEISDRLLKTDIRQKIYAPIKKEDISIEGTNALNEHIDSGLNLSYEDMEYKLRCYGSNCYTQGYVDDYREQYKRKDSLMDPPIELLLPDKIMLVNFNYTRTAKLYLKEGEIFSVNQIHGSLEDPSSVIFGYGDELDKDYMTILDKNENKFLGNIKSIRYLEANNYRKILSFIESAPYQILIMGHSCGNSDRTLLNRLFEHKNCVSIKPYYYKKNERTDSYLELVENISRNFTDMNLMRDRVVNKSFCELLTQ